MTSRTADTLAIGGTVHRRLRRVSSIFPVLAVAAALGCSSAGRDTATTDSSAAAPSASSATPAELKLGGDFQGPLGVQLYSFREAFKTDVRGTLARVRALGFREVELAGTYGMSAQQFRQALDSAGLTASSMHVGYEQLRDSLASALAAAKVLGPKYVGTAWIPHPDGPITVALARQAAADFNRWGKAARAEGLQFFYHAHGYEFKPGPDGILPMDVLMRETDPEAVKFEMDVFWASLPGNDPAALLRKYPGRWKLMHIKDMKKGVVTGVHTGSANPDSSEVPTGTGQTDYRAVLRAAKEVGVERYYLEDETVRPFETVPLSITWLSTVRFQ
jgi:sugar phosphate isomerase/epimerase